MDRKKKIIIGIVLVVIALFCTWQGVKSAEYTKACDAYDKGLEVYEEYVKVMDFACDKNGYIDKITVDTQLLHANEGEKFETRMYYYTLNVFLNNKFTELSDEEKCLILSRFRNAADDEMKRVREECGYEKCIEAIKNDMTGYDIKYRGRNINLWRSIELKFFGDNESYTFEPGEFEICTYADGFESRKYDYWYSLSEDKLSRFKLEEPKAKPKADVETIKAKSESASSLKKQITSSGSKSKKKVYNDGPRDIDDVDIDSFYEDNRDEFEDFDDAWDYMEDNPEEGDDY